MSFVDSVIDLGSSALKWATGSSTSAGLARTAALSYMLREVQSSINKDNDARNSNTGSTSARAQLEPSAENIIPVIYGNAYVGPKVVDAVMESNTVMWYALALSELTGPVMSTGQPSALTVDEVYWNNSRVVFKADGFTVSHLLDEEGNSTNAINGLVKFYAYRASGTPIRIGGYGNGTLATAWSRMPGWTSAHSMSGTLFVLARVEYHAQNGVTGLGDLRFRVNNTMKMPGDVLFDYMTNTRYGAGIPALEINS